MKIHLTFKTPGVTDAIIEQLDNGKELVGLDADELDFQAHDIEQKLEKWMRYGEYVTLEYDTELETLTALEV